MTNKKQTIAVFGFDGTITKKDTLFDFVRFSFGSSKLYLGLMAIFPILVAFKLKTISNAAAKQEMLCHFFVQKKYKDFLKKCDLYKDRINEITKQEAIDKIRWHQSEGHRVIIMSASIVDWIIPWAKSMGIEEVYGTTLEVTKEETITGRLGSENCDGEEKVKRFLAAYPERGEYTLYVYGDSKGDREMLALADHSYYRNF